MTSQNEVDPAAVIDMIIRLSKESPDPDSYSRTVANAEALFRTEERYAGLSEDYKIAARAESEFLLKTDSEIADLLDAVQVEDFEGTTGPLLTRGSVLLFVAADRLRSK